MRGVTFFFAHPISNKIDTIRDLRHLGFAPDPGLAGSSSGWSSASGSAPVNPSASQGRFVLAVIINARRLTEMKLRPVRVANAIAISQALIGVACAALFYLAPDLVMRISKAMAHPLNLDPLIPPHPWRIEFGELTIG